MVMRSFESRSWIWAAAAIVSVALAACGGGGGGYGGGNNNPPAAPPPPPPPTVSLSSPPTGTVYRTVPLTATATATAGVTRVEFLVDGASIATITATPYTTQWDTSAVGDGAHTITARVTDANNAVATTPAASVNVKNHPVISVNLSPDETLPRPVSTASGSGEFTINLIDGSVSGGVTTTGITVTASHIHDEFAGAAGPVIVPFVQS